MDQRNIVNVGAFRKPNVEMKYLPKLEKDSLANGLIYVNCFFCFIFGENKTKIREAYDITNNMMKRSFKLIL